VGRWVVELQPRPGVADGRRNLGPVADDARVGEAPRHVVVVEGGNSGRVEVGEGPPVAGSLVEDRRPRQPGLRTFEDQELEQHLRVALGDPPLEVVVGEVLGAARRPLAASRLAHVVPHTVGR
jgi:hypothetical protein